MNLISNEYQQHRVFARLKKMQSFYDDLHDSSFRFISTGTTTPFNLNTYVFSSISGTLESIHDILAKGRISDAFSLLRRYYDSAIINTYAQLYLKDNCSLQHFIVEKIDNWLKGTEPLPQFRVMSDYIHSSDKLKTVNDLLYKDERYKKLRNRCNDHTHYNFYHNVLYNDNSVHLSSRMKMLDIFSANVLDLFILHFAYIFTLNDYYMSSDDYVDALECDLEPAEDSQYWVAPYIQETFDEMIRPRRPDIAAEILSNTSMQLH